MSKIHLFPYGYFCRATLSRDGNKDAIEMQFQEITVVARGKGLEALCDALARLGVERIQMCPEKYGAIARNEGVIEDIEIKQRDREN
jgi:hypothetical protein